MQVFATMERAKGSLEVLDWGVANATLEEVSAAVSLCHEWGFCMRRQQNGCSHAVALSAAHLMQLHMRRDFMLTLPSMNYGMPEPQETVLLQVFIKFARQIGAEGEK